MKTTSTLLSAALICISSFINIQESLANPKHNAHLQDSLSSEKFIKQAMLYGMKALQTGGLAANNAANSGIKTFAKMMVTEHSKVNDELRTLATNKKISLPMNKPEGGLRPDGRVDATPENLKDTSRNQGMGEAGNNGSLTKKSSADAQIAETSISNDIDQLKGLKGSNFDKKYTEITISDHQNAIALFEAGSKVKDPAIRAYATKYLPVLKKHLSQITALSQK